MKIPNVIKKPSRTVKRVPYGKIDMFSQVLNEVEDDPYATMRTGRVMVRAWAKELDSEIRLNTIQWFFKMVILSYWQSVQSQALTAIPPLPDLYNPIIEVELDNTVLAVASTLGRAAARLDIISATYELGIIYTAIIPEVLRSDNGVYYTPPILTQRLIKMVSDTGVKWSEVSVLDPACGAGAFLAPITMRILKVLKHQSPNKILKHLEENLKGYEIDPFAAWLTQVFLEVILKDVAAAAGRRPKQMVTVCNSLEYHSNNTEQKFDLVIGNPPYGKLKLTDNIRSRYKESLYGHPNLYGLFTHLAIEMVKPGGVIGYLTPTSFLSGEYFKNLRGFIRKSAIPSSIDFVAVRKGVFEDVLQETVLAIYKKKNNSNSNMKVKVNEVFTLGNNKMKLSFLGHFKLAEELTSPWFLPRHKSHADIVKSMSFMKDNLTTWQYKISTGPLVWNRYKKQIKSTYRKNSYPIIWAESIRQDGTFILKAEKKNHEKWFSFKNGDEYLITKQSCLLLQRTTAKEQPKRLITAILPDQIIMENGAVVIENHVNMIIPFGSNQIITPKVLSVFLNSKAVNDAFRSISGSVAVSAYELESLPLPSPERLQRLSKLIAENASDFKLEEECLKLYTINK